jgi:hypothetical protein
LVSAEKLIKKHNQKMSRKQQYCDKKDCVNTPVKGGTLCQYHSCPQHSDPEPLTEDERNNKFRETKCGCRCMHPNCTQQCLDKFISCSKHLCRNCLTTINGNIWSGSRHVHDLPENNISATTLKKLPTLFAPELHGNHVPLGVMEKTNPTSSNPKNVSSIQFIQPMCVKNVYRLIFVQFHSA